MVSLTYQVNSKTALHKYQLMRYDKTMTWEYLYRQCVGECGDDWSTG